MNDSWKCDPDFLLFVAFAEYLAENGRVTKFLVHTVMRVYAWYGSVDQAVKFAEGVRREVGLTPGFLHVSFLFKMFGRAADVEKVCQLFDYIAEQHEWLFTKVRSEC